MVDLVAQFADKIPVDIRPDDGIAFHSLSDRKNILVSQSQDGEIIGIIIIPADNVDDFIDRLQFQKGILRG